MTFKSLWSRSTWRSCYIWLLSSYPLKARFHYWNIGCNLEGKLANVAKQPERVTGEAVNNDTANPTSSLDISAAMGAFWFWNVIILTAKMIIMCTSQLIP